MGNGHPMGSEGKSMEIPSLKKSAGNSWKMLEMILWTSTRFVQLPHRGPFLRSAPLVWLSSAPGKVLMNTSSLSTLGDKP